MLATEWVIRVSWMAARREEGAMGGGVHEECETRGGEREDRGGVTTKRGERMERGGNDEEKEVCTGSRWKGARETMPEYRSG